MRPTTWAEIFIALIISMFLYTGVIKLHDQDSFAFQIARSPLPVIASAAVVISWLVPTLEILVALSMLMQRTQKAALLAFIFMMSAFTIYIGGMLISDKPLPCSCGGFISVLSWPAHLVFNIAFIAMALAALRWRACYPCGNITAVNRQSLP